MNSLPGLKEQLSVPLVSLVSVAVIDEAQGAILRMLFWIREMDQGLRALTTLLQRGPSLTPSTHGAAHNYL